MIHGTESTTYNIDVVTEPFVPRLLSTLDRELDQLSRRMKRKRVEVRQAIESIIVAYNDAPSDKAKRDALTCWGA